MRGRMVAGAVVMLLLAGCGTATVQQARQTVNKTTTATRRTQAAATAALNHAEQTAIATDTHAQKQAGCRRITTALAAAHPPAGETQLARDWRAACRTVGITLTIP